MTGPRLRTAARGSPIPSFTPVRGPLLQRKCACGGTPGPTGECESCRKKKLQRKLAIGASNDPLEQEADRVADQVLAAPAYSAVSGAPPRIQRFTGQATEQAGPAPASVDHVLASSGRPLDPSLRQDMEHRFGHDFSRVRVHSSAAAEQSARDVNAHAYAVGQNIVFGAGRYAPATHEGRRLLAHELTHVIQQGSGPQALNIQRTPDDTHGPKSVGLAQDCGIPTLKCPPKSVLTNASSNTTLGTLVHNIVQEKYLHEYQPQLGEENFILIDRGWGEVHTKLKVPELFPGSPRLTHPSMVLSPSRPKGANEAQGRSLNVPTFSTTNRTLSPSLSPAHQKGNRKEGMISSIIFRVSR